MGKQKKIVTSKITKPNEKYLLIGFLALILLHTIGGFWHSYYSWGFSYWSLFPNSIIIIYGVVTMLAVWKVYALRNELKLNFLDSLIISHKSKPVSIARYIAIYITLFFILYLFRSQAHFYGDGYLILGNILSLQDIFAEPKNFMELLTIYLYYFVIAAAQSFGSFSTADVLGLLNSVAGVLGLWAMWSISSILHKSPSKRNFIFITALSSASIILFFGYIENYTWALVCGLWTLRFSLGYIKNVNRIIPLLLFAFLSIGFHLIALPFFLIAVYAVLLRANKTKFISNINMLFISLFFVIGTLVVVWLGQIKGSTIFVPLWEIPKNTYTLLSIEHLSDILNQLILVAPLGLVLLIVVFLNKKNKNATFNVSSKILYLLSFLTFLSAIVIDPQLGAVRDWDLLSFYGIPLTIYAGYSFSELYENKQFPSWIVVASCIIIIAHVVPNLYEKNHPKMAVEQLDKILWNDPHYQSDYQDAFRVNSWAYILKNSAKRADLSEKYFVRRRKAYSNDSKASYNLGVLYYEQGKNEEARHYLLKSLELNSQAPKIYSKLSLVELKAQNDKLAEQYALESLKLDTNHAHAWTALGVIYNNKNMTDDALFYFKKSYALQPNDFEQNINLAIIYSKGVSADSAYFYFKKAEMLAPENRRVNILRSLIAIALNLNRREEAIEYFNQLKLVAPNSVVVRELEKEIYKL